MGLLVGTHGSYMAWEIMSKTSGWLNITIIMFMKYDVIATRRCLIGDQVLFKAWLYIFRLCLGFRWCNGRCFTPKLDTPVLSMSKVQVRIRNSWIQQRDPSNKTNYIEVDFNSVPITKLIYKNISIKKFPMKSPKSRSHLARYNPILIAHITDFNIHFTKTLRIKMPIMVIHRFLTNRWDCVSHICSLWPDARRANTDASVSAMNNIFMCT